jgi:hypothetical protein
VGDNFWLVGDNLRLVPWGDIRKSGGPSGVAGHLPNCKSLVSVVELEVSEEERSKLSVSMLNLDRWFALGGSLGGGGNPNSIASSNSSGEDIARKVLRISGSL